MLAAASFLLAAKSLDEPVSLAHLAEIYVVLENERNSSGTGGKVPRWLREEYEERLANTEFEILCNLGFDCELELPSPHIAQFCQDAQSDPLLEKHSYMFLNDSFLTQAALFFHPKVIAAACLLMSHVFLQKMGFSAALPEQWLSLIDPELTLELVGECKDEIKKVYRSGFGAPKSEADTRASSSSSSLY